MPHRVRPAGFVLLALGLVLAAACAPDAPLAPGPAESPVPILLDLTAFPRVETVVIEVTAPDITPALVFNLALDEGLAHDTLTLPIGAERTVTVRGFDIGGLETHRGQVTVDIVEGMNDPVVVALRAVTGDQPIEIVVDTVRILLDPSALTLLTADTGRITPTVETTSGVPVDASLQWASTNPAVATVDAEGLVTAHSMGQAVVVATWAGVAGVATVTVTDIDVTIAPVTAPLVRAMQLDLSPAESVTVEYWTDGVPPLRVAAPPAASHDLLLTRLVANATWEYVVQVGTDGPTLTGSFTTGPLPAGFDGLGLDVTGELTAPLVMLELRVPTFQGFAAVDGQGRVRWFHPTSGSSWGWTRRANGNFVFLDTGEGLNEVTPSGDIVATLFRAGGEVIHHDVQVSPQNTVYFMTRHAELVDGTSWVGERIWEWDPDTDALDIRWNSFDVFDPATDQGPFSTTGDWLHTNAITIGVSGNILISSAFFEQVFAISPDFSSVVWRLNGPNASLVPDADAFFSFQHTATEIAENRVLLFDNRGATEGGQPISRALELELNPADSSATTAWEFRPPNGNYAAIISSAWRMENGNTLVAFGPGEGLVGSTGPIEVYEVAPDGTIVWNLVVTGPNHMFRATAVAAIAGEREVSP